MDRNSIIGLLLIGAILIGYSIMTQPSDEELEAMKLKRDSIAAVEDRKRAEAERAEREIKPDEISENEQITPAERTNDTLQIKRLAEEYGSFAQAAQGENEFYTLENELVKIDISQLGGKVARAELKQYQTYHNEPLYLFTSDSVDFGLNFFDNNKLIYTEKLYFEAVGESASVVGDGTATLAMRLYSEQDRDHYIEYLYTLKGNSYTVDLDINIVGLNDIVQANAGLFGLKWGMGAIPKEKSVEAERMQTTVYYKYKDDEVDYISEGKSEGQEPLVSTVEWVSFKQQFFSAALISPVGFDKSNANVEVKSREDAQDYTKYLETNLTIPFERGINPSFPMMFYFGPNHYQTLTKMGLGLEEQIDLGWWIFGLINKWLIIPAFNFLEGFNISYGIIILLLTIFVKTLLFPITYKNYKSSAKMNVLKPEIEELNAKFKDDEAMKKQQAVMGLYRKAGVNPMAGCIPMLLQIPILYAMFRFFPSSIELRQESFLWAEDLSTYDSIFSLPFTIPFYGDHVSLFTILMAASTFFYTKFNTQMSVTSGPQAAQMKIMMNFMPLMLLFFFNSFAAGLSYYYFTANVISMAQQVVIKKWFIDEEKIKRQIAEHKKKPAKKSKFQERLEKMAKERGYQPPKGKKK